LKNALMTLALGVLMGVVLSRIGFSSWDEVHRMFVFADLRMFLTFAFAVVLIASATVVLRKVAPDRVRRMTRSFHRGTILGGAMFGIGWALSGACPSIALVQVGEGQLAAFITLGGIVSGNWLYAALRERYLHWDTGSCVDD